MRTIGTMLLGAGVVLVCMKVALHGGLLLFAALVAGVLALKPPAAK